MCQETSVLHPVGGGGGSFCTWFWCPCGCSQPVGIVYTASSGKFELTGRQGVLRTVDYRKRCRVSLKQARFVLVSRSSAGKFGQSL